MRRIQSHPRYSIRLATLAALLWCAVGIAQEVDLAAKKLAAANGLYQRQLYKLAAEDYAAFLKDYPTHQHATAARYGLAVCQFRLAQFTDSASTLQTVLKDDTFPQHDEAMLVLGHCHLSQKDYPKALAAFESLIAKHPKTPSAETAALNRAQALYMLGRKAECAAACEAFLKSYPDSSRRPEAMYFLALGQHGTAKDDDAIKTLTELNKTYPNSRHQLDAYLLMGQCLETQGKFDKAAEQYQLMIQSAPPERKAEGQFALGVVMYRAGRHDESIKSLSAVLADKSNTTYAAPARLQLGLTLWAARKIDQARSVLSDVTKTDPARANVARYWLAQCDIIEKKHESARAILDDLAKLQPPPVDPAQLAMDRADCLLGMQKYTQAAGEYETFQKAHPAAKQVKEATYRQAFCLHKADQHGKSLEVCLRIMADASHPFASQGRELAAENLFLLARYDEAEKLFVQLSQSTIARDARQRFVLRTGQCAYFAGKYDRAIEVLRPLADDKTASADAELSRAMLLCGDALLQKQKYREAAEMLGRYVAAGKSEKLEAQFKLGLAQLRGGGAASAERTFADVMKQQPDSPWVMRAHFEYGQLKYKQNQPAKAAEALNKLASLNPPAELAAPTLYLLAWIDLDAKRHAEAAKRFGEVTQRFAQHALAAESQFHRATALKEMANWQEAAAAYQQYLSAHPDGAYAFRARQLLAACMVRMDKHQQAIKLLESLAADSKTATDEIVYDLAWSQQAAKDTPAAEASYRRLLKDFPNSRLATPARCELAELLYQQDKYAEAAELLEKVVADKSADAKTSAVAIYRLGSCYEKLNDPARAAEMFKGFLSRKGNDELVAWAHYQAGVNLARQNKLTEAQQHFSSVLRSDAKPELASLALLKLGEVQAQSQDFPSSAATYQRFLDQYPKDRFIYQAQFGLGWAMENQKKYDDARQWYGKVIATHNGPTAARAQFQIGETHFAQSNYEKAAAALLAVADVYAYPEWSARALVEAGRAFEQLKQIDQAKQQYETVVRKYKDAPEATIASQRLKVLTP